MASLQEYSGKGKDKGKTFYRIQPRFDGKRPTFRLGSGKKKAKASLKAIDDLVDCKRAGSDEFNASTKVWLESKADRAICDLLLSHELITELPRRFVEAEALANITTISTLATSYIKTRGAGQAAGTLEVYHKAKRNLIDCFGDVDVTTVRPLDAREFWRWLIEDGSSIVQKGETKGLSANTAKQRLRYAQGFFEQAVEDGLIIKNPFKIKGLTTSQSAAEKDYVPVAAIKSVIEHCTSTEWKLLFALVRNIPIRVPSEIQELTWDDVDWERNQILVHSPKTRSIGKSARLVPIFPMLKEWLEIAFHDARQASETGRVRDQFIFSTLRLNSNPATTAKKFVLRAKLEPWLESTWTNFWNSLRASTETDLMDEYGLRRACQWAGNSPATAMKNYALVRKTDFIDVGSTKKVDAKSDAILVVDAKSDAEWASVGEQKPNKKRTVENGESSQCVKVGVEGLEPPTLSV